MSLEDITGNSMRLRARKEGDFGRDHICIALFSEDRKIAGEVVIKPIPDHGLISPLVRISTHEAQIFMDDLWDCGIRPTEGSGSAGAMRAIEKHLEDMRKIAFHHMAIHEVGPKEKIDLEKFVEEI